jgi:hypothetical protein
MTAKEIVMPKQKDLKRVVRTRMQKTGESYTAARRQVLHRKEHPVDYAALAGMNDEAVRKGSGRDWAEWVNLLDAAGSAKKAHREIALHVSSLGAPSWWTQAVTVGYERIKGLRKIGQRRDGGFEANKSRTFAVPVEQLFKAFADARTRSKWLPKGIVIRTANASKRMRLRWSDGTPVQLEFMAKKPDRSAVAVQHSKLPDKAAADRMKAEWAERFEKLAKILS